MTIIDQLNAKVERDRASDDEVARIVGMTAEEYDADVTRLDHADESYIDDPPDPPSDLCFNCGCYGVENPWDTSEYECPNCGDIWSIYAPPPDIP